MDTQKSELTKENEGENFLKNKVPVTKNIKTFTSGANSLSNILSQSKYFLLSIVRGSEQ